MGVGVSGFEQDQEVAVDGISRSGNKTPTEKTPTASKRRSRPFSQEVTSPIPLDIGSRDVSLVGPQQLGLRNSSAPAAAGSRRNTLRNDLLAKGIGVGASGRRPRNTSFKSGARDEYIMRRFSYMRNGQRMPTGRRRSKGRMSTERRCLGDTSKKIKLDPDEITAIAASTQGELAKHGYTLQQWEELYKELSRLYDKLNKRGIPDGASITSEDSDFSLAQAFLGISKFTLENALSKISKCIESHPEFKEQQKAKWSSWEAANESKNKIALRQMQAFVPIDIKSLTAKDIVEQHGRSWPLAKRLVDKKIFHLLYMSTSDILRIHHSDFSLKGRLDYSALDITELRAIYYSTRECGLVKWRKRMRELLYEYTIKEQNKTLSKFTKRHHAYLYKPNKRTQSTAGPQEEKERITVVLRAKAKCLFSELEGKSSTKKKDLLSRVERFTGSTSNKYTKMVRRRLSLDEDEKKSTGSSFDFDEVDRQQSEEEVAACFDNFYTNGSFTVPQHKKKKIAQEEDSDDEEMESIEQLIKELSMMCKSPEELEKILAMVFQ